MQHLSLSLTDALKHTIERLEETMPDESKVGEIKRRVLLRLAEVQEPSTRHRRRVLLVVSPEEEEEP